MLDIFFRRKRRAAAEVLNTPPGAKSDLINFVTEPYGFMYDIKRDLFYSRLDSWQRELGYCALYDEKAPLMNMVIESEPVEFKYKGRRWLIELWKGQYGMCCGAEIGVYVTDKDDIHIPNVYKGPFYECVDNSELLKLGMRVYRDGKELFARNALHWWLTGFKLGEFAEPKILRVSYDIVFPDEEMRDAFLVALFDIGYTESEVSYLGKTVSLIFDRPKTRQPQRHNRLTTYFIQKVNRHNCKRYLRLTRRFEHNADRLYYASLCLPGLYRLLLKFSGALAHTGSRKRVIKKEAEKIFAKMAGG